MNQLSTLDPQQLAQAFQAFNLASSDLCAAYEELQQQAHVLTEELALANGELRRQFAEKEALREAALRAERLAAMGGMAARLAHQLRTPLSTALLYAAQLGDAALPAAERSRFADKTVERLHHLERLIEDMLLFVRGASAGSESVSAANLLQEVCQIMEPQALARGLLFECSDESDDCLLKADRQALSGALISLLENAVQACTAGQRINLGARVTEKELIFYVSDTGAGMQPDVRARLFEPFFTTRTGGTGLGLAIVRAVAEAHGGSIDVQSASGKGSEFLLRLPFTGRTSATAEIPSSKQGVEHALIAAAHC